MKRVNDETYIIVVGAVSIHKRYAPITLTQNESQICYWMRWSIEYILNKWILIEQIITRSSVPFRPFHSFCFIWFILLNRLNNEIRIHVRWFRKILTDVEIFKNKKKNKKQDSNVVVNEQNKPNENYAQSFGVNKNDDALSSSVPFRLIHNKCHFCRFSCSAILHCTIVVGPFIIYNNLYGIHKIQLKVIKIIIIIIINFRFRFRSKSKVALK